MADKTFHQRNDCRACNSTDISVIVPFPATPVGDHYCATAEAAKQKEHYPLDLYLCENCGLLQLTAVVSPDVLYGNFTYETSVSKGLPEHFREYARDIAARLGLKPHDLVVDIGSNDGTLLSMFKELGCKVQGVDPATAIANRASERGIPTISSLFDSSIAAKIRESVGEPALVVSNNTFANIDEPGVFLKAVKSLLGKQGALVMETGYGPDVVERGLFDTIYHEHLSYFSLASMASLFARSGFTVFDAEYIATKGGSLRVLAAPEENPRPQTARLKEMLEEEHQRFLKIKESGAALSEKMRSHAERLKELIASYRSQGKRVYGYGASVGVTTFLYTFGLETSFDSLVDDNPVKYEQYSPGLAVQVHPSSILQDDPSGSVAVILAWRYSAPIRKRHEAFVQNGGTIVVPWPEFEIVTR